MSSSLPIEKFCRWQLNSAHALRLHWSDFMQNLLQLTWTFYMEESNWIRVNIWFWHRNKQLNWITPVSETKGVFIQRACQRFLNVSVFWMSAQHADSGFWRWECVHTVTSIFCWWRMQSGAEMSRISQQFHLCHQIGGKIIKNVKLYSFTIWHYA